MSTCFRLPIAALLCGLTAGCGLSGSYPSLAPRPGEVAESGQPVCDKPGAGGCGPQATPPAPPPPVPAVADPAVKAQVDRLLGEAREGEAAFRAELPSIERTVAAAGPAGSDSWGAAQVALSRLEATRTPTTVAAAELDALARARVEAAPSAAQADVAAINAAAEQVGVLVAGQDQAIGRLTAALPSP
jgi:hypothetical protein